ncbi:hypothetical protein [Porphyrobacter sp. GA68]|uniref:hypothetical protein n=1 Tax=Porphyrobacter sp. GA68 TaxID=2883480 RepID=UPI001D19116B|nr:hypothetical protein [Porphyrobacter sp. GA68]
MALIMIFILGVGNFALHRAVLDSDHPLIRQLTRGRGARGGGIMLAFEFLLLTAAMMLAANEWPEVAFAYALYSALNLVTGWMILSRRL